MSCKDFEVGSFISSYSLLRRKQVGEILVVDEPNLHIRLIDISNVREPIRTMKTIVLHSCCCRIICSPYKTAENIIRNRCSQNSCLNDDE